MAACDSSLLAVDAGIRAGFALYGGRSGAAAKERADGLARRVIEWSGIPGATSLRHDAAEAILLGLWAVVEIGWLEAVPNEVAQD